MKKTRLNLIIDGLLLLLVSAMAGMGLLMKYVLVPGYLRWEIYGRNVELFFLGLDRHEWGKIHLIIGYIFLGLLLLHVFLHWRMIIETYRKMIPNRLARRVTAAVLIIIIIALFTFSFFVKPTVSDGGRGKGPNQHQIELPEYPGS